MNKSPPPSPMPLSGRSVKLPGLKRIDRLDYKQNRYKQLKINEKWKKSKFSVTLISVRSEP